MKTFNKSLLSMTDQEFDATINSGDTAILASLPTASDSEIDSRLDHNILKKIQQRNRDQGEQKRCGGCGEVIPSFRNTRYCSDSCRRSAHSFRRRVSYAFRLYKIADFEIIWLSGSAFEIIFPENSWFKFECNEKVVLPSWASNQFKFIAGHDAVRAAFEEFFTTQTERVIFRETTKQWKSMLSRNDIPDNPSDYFLAILQDKVSEFKMLSTFVCCQCHKFFPNFEVVKELSSCGSVCRACCEYIPF